MVQGIQKKMIMPSFKSADSIGNAIVSPEPTAQVRHRIDVMPATVVL
jgi:hypothetical protein